MEVYSPKSQKADNFKKNTLRKNDIMINNKSTLTGRTVIFEMENEDHKINIRKCSLVTSMFDFLKLKFYDRMKVFFDYEDRFKEKTAIK